MTNARFLFIGVSAFFRGTPRSDGKKGLAKRATQPQQLFWKMQELRERSRNRETVIEWPLFKRSCGGEAQYKKAWKLHGNILLYVSHVVREKKCWHKLSRCWWGLGKAMGKCEGRTGVCVFVCVFILWQGWIRPLFAVAPWEQLHPRVRDQPLINGPTGTKLNRHTTCLHYY